MKNIYKNEMFLSSLPNAVAFEIALAFFVLLIFENNKISAFRINHKTFINPNIAGSGTLMPPAPYLLIFHGA